MENFGDPRNFLAVKLSWFTVAPLEVTSLTCHSLIGILVYHASLHSYNSKSSQTMKRICELNWYTTGIWCVNSSHSAWVLIRAKFWASNYFQTLQMFFIFWCIALLRRTTWTQVEVLDQKWHLFVSWQVFHSCNIISVADPRRNKQKKKIRVSTHIVYSIMKMDTLDIIGQHMSDILTFIQILWSCWDRQKAELWIQKWHVGGEIPKNMKRKQKW